MRRHPATRSRILIDMLRGEMGFTGAYVTDCLHMGAAAQESGTVSAAVDALAAGADLLLISHSIDMAHEAVERIVAAVATREPADRAFRRGQRARVGAAPRRRRTARRCHLSRRIPVSAGRSRGAVSRWYEASRTPIRSRRSSYRSKVRRPKARKARTRCILRCGARRRYSRK